MRATHSSDLERWLGTDTVEHVSRSMQGWYGPPIALAGVPGNVRVCGDGDFIGRCNAGRLASGLDYAEDLAKRFLRAARTSARSRSMLCAGFSSLEDLLSNESKSKQQLLRFAKTGTAATQIGGTNTLWYVGANPIAGTSPSGSADGTQYTSSSTGAMNFSNAAAGDTAHFLSGYQVPSVTPQTLLLYDRLWSMDHNVGTTATISVTGSPLRYQGTSAWADDSAAGNFLFVEVRTALPATSHSWNFTYIDQGNSSSNAPNHSGINSSVANSLDHNTGQWFVPLAGGDFGVQRLSSAQISATLASGTISISIGHPIAFLPSPLTTAICEMSSLQTAFNFARIFDDACLALLELVKPATTATTYQGSITVSAG